MARSTPILVLDGGLGTTLEDKYGVVFSGSTPMWSSHLLVTDQPTLFAAQSAFVSAGADVILTATYQFSIDGFARTRTPQWPDGISRNDIPHFLDDAVRIAEAATGRRSESTATMKEESQARIALALGPYGACMSPSQEYTGAYDDEHDSVESLLAWHTERWRAVAEVDGLRDRIDYVAFETVPRVDEVIAIRQLLGSSSWVDFGPKRSRVWISCLFPGDGETLPDGTAVDQLVDSMLSGDVSRVVPWGIGINCTRVSKLAYLVEKYEAAVAALVNSGRLDEWPSLALYPDGTNGEVYNTTTGRWEIPTGKAVPEVSGACPLGNFLGSSMAFMLIANRLLGKSSLRLSPSQPRKGADGDLSLSEVAARQPTVISSR